MLLSIEMGGGRRVCIDRTHRRSLEAEPSILGCLRQPIESFDANSSGDVPNCSQCGGVALKTILKVAVRTQTIMVHKAHKAHTHTHTHTHTQRERERERERETNRPDNVGRLICARACTNCYRILMELHGTWYTNGSFFAKINLLHALSTTIHSLLYYH